MGLHEVRISIIEVLKHPYCFLVANTSLISPVLVGVINSRQLSELHPDLSLRRISL
jgi:hypothetical protein